MDKEAKEKLDLLFKALASSGAKERKVKTKYHPLIMERMKKVEEK